MSIEPQNQIARERLSQLTGVSVLRLSQIAAEGFFPKAEKGKYDFAKSLSGLLRYYKETCEKLPVFDSIDACVGATGIPRAVMRYAKRCGCQAFVGSRVNLAALLAWLYDPANEKGKAFGLNVDELKRKKVQEEARLLELKREELEGVLVRLEDVKKWASESVYAFKVEMLSLPGKLAPQVVGLTIAEAELRIRNDITDSLRKMSREPWEQEP